MVCEKLSTCDHDFLMDPIPYYIEEGIMRTKGTTLGADDGIAISYMLRLLETGDVDASRLRMRIYDRRRNEALWGSRIKYESFKRETFN